MNIVQTFAILFILWFPFRAHVQGHKIHKRLLNSSINSNKDYITFKNKTYNLNPKLLHKSVNENDFLNVTTKQDEKMSVEPHPIKELQIANHEFFKNASKFETPENVSSNNWNTSQMVISTTALTNRTDSRDHNTTNMVYSKLAFENNTSKYESVSISEVIDIEPEMDVVFGIFETNEPKIVNSSLKDSPSELESLPMIFSIFATANKSGLIFGGLQMEESLINQIKAELSGSSDLLDRNQPLVNNFESAKYNEVMSSTFKPLEAPSTRRNLSIVEK